MSLIKNTAVLLNVFIALMTALGAMNIWIITKLFDVNNDFNNKLELVRTELVATNNNLSAQINDVGKQLIALNAALGESPERIRLAVLSVEQTGRNLDQIVTNLNSASSRIISLENTIESLAGNVNDTNNEVKILKGLVAGPLDPERGLLAAVSMIRQDVALLKEAMGIKE